MRSAAILFTTALALMASTSAFPAQDSDTTVTVQPTSDVSATQSSASPEATQSNVSLPDNINGLMDNISKKCLNTLKGIVIIGNTQSCIPAKQLEPIWNQTLYDPMNAPKYVSQGLDILCQAPECPQVALKLASKELKHNCNSEDENQLLVQAASAFVNNYGGLRKLACEKSSSNDETNNDQNSDNSTQYCLGDATQFYMNKSLLILTGKWKEDPQQLCPPCADTWHSDLNQIEPQYEDFKKWGLAAHLEDVCPNLKNSTSTDSQSSASDQTTATAIITSQDSEATATQSQPDDQPTAAPTENQPDGTSEPTATPTEQPGDDEETTVVVITTTQ